MALSLPHLRRWFAVAAVSVVMLVAGAYFYARHRVQNALKQVPAKIGLDIQQSSEGFTVSSSVQGRTLFKIRAKKAIQFAGNGRWTLQDVDITLYGRDSRRFDQIYGSSFVYDATTGDVTAQGEVQIDLEANPTGLVSPDQMPPREMKDPIHLKTSGLVFNQKSGNAHTDAKVEFRVAQANGSAVGVDYLSKTQTLTLGSKVQIDFTGEKPLALAATHGLITSDPRTITLESVEVQRERERGQAEEATLYLTEDNVLNRIDASHVRGDLGGKQAGELHADKMDAVLQGAQSQVQQITLSGNVGLQRSSDRARIDAGRVLLDFAHGNLLAKVHAEQNVKIFQPPVSETTSGRQEMEIQSAAMDLFVVDGKRLTRAQTPGPAEIDLRSTGQKAGSTTITANTFVARFNDLGQLISVHGEPNARVVSNNPGEPVRISTSTSVEATFSPGAGMETATQQGHVIYTEGDRQAWAERGIYTPGNQMLELQGSPRMQDENMATTADHILVNRATGEASAKGQVKSTYNDLKPQPNGALLAASSPIHVTADRMSLNRDPAVAVYTGNARLWQDANLVTAPSIQFNRRDRSILARGSATEAISTVLISSTKDGKKAPLAITSEVLSYVDSERKVHFGDGVTAKGSDFNLTCLQMDAFLQKKGPNVQANKTITPETGNLDRIVATGQVVITQPGRVATGDQLVYTESDDKFVLNGGPPSIFDAERGRITGVSLTLFRGDDRVLVEGTKTSPSTTQTRVAR